MQLTRRLSLAVEGTAGALPTEFRLFTAGWNDTENGRYLFDEAAAKATMDAYAKWGVDLAIDLEHQMLEPNIAPDPTAKDARGWCKLELREDGSLWAVNVTWTPDGAARLTEKRQRYVSPAFSVDPETSRVIQIVNVAITAIPATHETPALVAASRTARDFRKLAADVAFSDVSNAISGALAERFPRNADSTADGPWIQDVFDTKVVYQLNGSLYEVPYSFDGAKATLGPTAVEVKRAYVPVEAAAAPPAPEPAAANKMTRRVSLSAGERMDPKQIAEALDALIAGDAAKCMEILKGIVATAAGGEAPPSEEPAPEAAAAAEVAPAEEDKPAEVAAALSTLARLSGKPFVASVADIQIWHASHLELETERQKLAKERETLESAERRKLCVELVTLGGRAPSAVWADDKAIEPKPYLAKMPIDDLRAMHADELKAKGAKPGAAASSAVKAPVTPAAGPGGKSFPVGDKIVELSARELQICAESKCDPATFAMLKARRATTPAT